MIVDYIGNTGFLVTLQSGEKVALDWWMLTQAFHGAWSLFPAVSEADREYFLSENRPDYVFISHLHTDHLDPGVLKQLDPKTPILIGKRSHPHLTRSLGSLGLKNIVEIEFEQEHRFGDFSVVLFDDFSVDAPALTDQVRYQLDSSILIKGRDGTSFLNLNDNIPSRAQAERIAQRFGTPDAAALVCSSASSYPQAFLNYDDALKVQKREELVQKTTGRFYDVMAGLAPRIAIPCGGVVLNGVLSKLNRFAHMKADGEQMNRRRAELPAGSELVILEARDRLELRSDDHAIESSGSEPISFSQQVAEAAGLQLDHERICVPGSFRILLPNLLRRARQNLWRRQESLNLYPDWLVTLRVEPLGSIRPEDSLGPMELSYTFDLKSPEPVAAPDESRQRIEFVLDARLLLMVLISATVWDNVYTASLVQTRRQPDLFDVNLVKLMSFFAI